MKRAVADTLATVAEKNPGELPDLIYQAISYLTYDLVPESYLRIIHDLTENE